MRSHPYIHLMGQGFVAQWFCPHDAPRIVPWDGDLYKGAPSPCPHGVPQLTPWDGHLWHGGDPTLQGSAASSRAWPWTESNGSSASCRNPKWGELPTPQKNPKHPKDLLSVRGSAAPPKRSQCGDGGLTGPPPPRSARYLGTLLQVEVMLKVWFPHVAPKAGPEPDPVGVLLLLRDRRRAHGDGATSGTSGGTSGTASGVTAETTPTGTTQPKCPLPTRTGAPTPPAAPDV